MPNINHTNFTKTPLRGTTWDSNLSAPPYRSSAARISSPISILLGINIKQEKLSSLCQKIENYHVRIQAHGY
jgi:hypothetical protein